MAGADVRNMGYKDGAVVKTTDISPSATFEISALKLYH